MRHPLCLLACSVMLFAAAPPAALAHKGWKISPKPDRLSPAGQAINVIMHTARSKMGQMKMPLPLQERVVMRLAGTAEVELPTIRRDGRIEFEGRWGHPYGTHDLLAVFDSVTREVRIRIGDIVTTKSLILHIKANPEGGWTLENDLVKNRGKVVLTRTAQADEEGSVLPSP